MDHVDRILAQWNREWPDLDVGPMGLLGRFGRVRAHLSREIENVLAEHDLSGASFDVLATLRRSGAPYRLSPGDLLVIYSDGISEAMNPDDEEWGEERLAAAVRANGGPTAETLIARMFEAADGFASGAVQHDDMTLVVVRLDA